MKVTLENNVTVQGTQPKYTKTYPQIFVAPSTYNERNALKEAKGLWDGERKPWWLYDPANGALLFEYADDVAKAALQGTIEALAGSRATSSAAIERPSGLWQRAV